MAALLGAEEVAGSADFEVAHGDFEAGAEFGVLFDGGDAFSGVSGGEGVPREEEVGVGAVACTAYAASELVEVGEAEAVGAVDDDGVGVGDVDAAFDDGGGEEDVRFSAYELPHDVFKVAFVHLSVADDDTGFGDELVELVSHVVDGLDAVVEEEDLSAAFEFAFDGIFDEFFVVGADGGLYGRRLRGAVSMVLMSRAPMRAM